MEEGHGSSETDYAAIETTANSLDNSIIFHVIKDVLGFVLYMHQQIPSILQDISLEFETLQTEYKELQDTSLTQAEVKPSSRRKQNGRMREVKSSIRRLDKLMKTISGLEMALQLLITEICVEGVILVLGASPIRPRYVYQLCFSHGHNVQRGGGFVKSRGAEGLSRKAIRALISKGAGSASYSGPTKLFVLVKAPSSFNLPLHFLPKRDFRYSKKIVPFRLLLKCRSQDLEIDPTEYGSENSSTISLRDSSSNDLIWFQCRHVIKGLAFNIPTEE